jgi:hypothetical protein
MSETIYLSRQEVVDRDGKSDSSIRRADREGKLPGRKIRESGGAVVYPLAELVAAGLIDPFKADGPVGERGCRRPMTPPASPLLPRPTDRVEGTGTHKMLHSRRGVPPAPKRGQRVSTYAPWGQS